MPNILPSTIARPATAVLNGRQINSKFSTPLVTGIKDSFNTIAGVGLGILEKQAKEDEEQKRLQAQLKAREQQVSAKEAYNRIVSEQKRFNDDYNKNTPANEVGGYKQAFEEFSAKSYATNSDGLSPETHKLIQNSMRLSKQSFLDHQYEINKRKLSIANNKADAVSMQQNIDTGIQQTVIPGKEDTAMNSVKIDHFSASKKDGGGHTRRSVAGYAKSSNQSLPENFATQPLSDSRAIVQKELDALRKTAPADSEELAKKNALLSAIDSATVSENYVQRGVDTVQGGRFNNYLAAGDLQSASNLLDNADPTPETLSIDKAIDKVNKTRIPEDERVTEKSFNEDQKNPVSQKVHDEMSSLLTKHKNIALTEQVSLAAFDFSKTDFNYKTDTMAQYDLNVAKGRNLIIKNIKDSKLQKQALTLFNSRVADQKEAYKATVVIEQSTITTDWVAGSVPKAERENQIAKLSTEYSNKFIDKLKTASTNIEGKVLHTADGVMKQNKIEFEVGQAIRTGFGTLNGVQVEVDSADKAVNLFLQKGGSTTTERKNAIKAMFNNKDQVVDEKTLEDVLAHYGYTLESAVQRNIGSGLRKILPITGNPATLNDTKAAVQEWLKQNLFTMSSSFNFGGSRFIGGTREELWGKIADGEDSLISNERLNQRFIAEYNDLQAQGVKPNWMVLRNGRPTPDAIARYATKNKLELTNNYGRYKRTKEFTARYIKGYKHPSLKGNK